MITNEKPQTPGQEKQQEKETEKNKAQTLKNIYFCIFLILSEAIKTNEKPQAPETRKTERERNRETTRTRDKRVKQKYIIFRNQ